MTELRCAVAAAYLIGAMLALLAGRTSPLRERRFWFCAAAALVLMGISKQLQLQDELTGTARELLKAAGWYDWHEDAQGLLAAMVAVVLVGAFVMLGSWLRHSDRSVKTAAAALLLLLAFVIVRAASLHALDPWVTREMLGMRLGWWVELAGIAVIAGSAVACLRARKRWF